MKAKSKRSSSKRASSEKRAKRQVRKGVEVDKRGVPVSVSYGIVQFSAPPKREFADEFDKYLRSTKRRYVPTRNYGRISTGPILYFLTHKEIVDTFSELERRFREEPYRYVSEFSEAGREASEQRLAHARANYFLKVCREVGRP